MKLNPAMIGLLVGSSADRHDYKATREIIVYSRPDSEVNCKHESKTSTAKAVACV